MKRECEDGGGGGAQAHQVPHDKEDLIIKYDVRERLLDVELLTGAWQSQMQVSPLRATYPSLQAGRGPVRAPVEMTEPNVGARVAGPVRTGKSVRVFAMNMRMRGWLCGLIVVSW